MGERAGDDEADVAALTAYAADLVAAVERAIPSWVQRSVERVWAAWGSGPADAALLRDAAAAGEAARADVVPRLRALLTTDVERQRSNPLALLRSAVAHPTRVLAAAGVPEVDRDEAARRLFPDDRYDLTPGAFGDLGPEVHEAGLRWGAAKAHVILARRRRAGA